MIRIRGKLLVNGKVIKTVVVGESAEEVSFLHYLLMKGEYLTNRISLVLYFVTFLYICVTNSYGQTVKLYFTNDTNKVNPSGQVINKGDNFDVIVYADGNNNISVRSLYFDF